MSLLSFQGSRSGHFSPSCGRVTAPPPCSRLRNASAGQGLPQPQPGKWHRPSAVTQKRHQQRPKGEAAKQRASEQPFFTNLSLERTCMKMWCSINRKSANRCRELCALWSSLPVADTTITLLGEHRQSSFLQRGEKTGIIIDRPVLQPAE
jgi:hypothetical protein